MIKSDKNKAILWMLGAMTCLLSVSILGKLLAPDYSTFEIMFYRSIFGFLVFVALLLVTRQIREVRVRNIKLHLLRNIIHFTAQNLWFFALSVLPLSVVIAFEFTTPSWVIIFAAILLREGFGWRRSVVILLSLIGVFIITNPSGFHFNFTSLISLSPIWAFFHNVPLLAAVCAAIGFAGSIIATKSLTRVQSVNEILLMMTLMQGVFAGLIILWEGTLAPIVLSMLPWLILIGIFGTMSHYCLTKALSLADASTISPIDLIRLPMSIFLGSLIFGEAITYLVIIGTAFLLLANYINIRIKAENKI